MPARDVLCEQRQDQPIGARGDRARSGLLRISVVRMRMLAINRPSKNGPFPRAGVERGEEDFQSWTRVRGPATPSPNLTMPGSVW